MSINQVGFFAVSRLSSGSDRLYPLLCYAAMLLCCYAAMLLCCYAAGYTTLFIHPAVGWFGSAGCFSFPRSIAAGWILLNFCSLEISKFWNNYKGLFVFLFFQLNKRRKSKLKNKIYFKRSLVIQITEIIHLFAF